MLTSDSALEEQTSHSNFDFLWNPVHRKRAKELSMSYNPDSLKVWLRYVIEGGGHDMFEFVNKYSGRFRYMGSKEQNISSVVSREEYYRRIKLEMQSISVDTHFPFLYCPFMKKRAMELVGFGVNYDMLSSAVSYIMTGHDNTKTKYVNENAKKRYLKRTGVLP